ncbi:TagK domain-containing protein [Burkholderia ubonensis]|uniref:TagK domain-containing protein n=1 Tax=Burkholderia ubonensis TaxID=101571 RepID=UPI002AB22739|nr:TagK domain-containing protein [Burkholderia ubonensis]
MSTSPAQTIDRILAVGPLDPPSSDRSPGSAAILELIGNSSLDGRIAPAQRNGDTPEATRHTAGEAAHVDDLIEGLHAQYWRALTDPHAAFGGPWVEQSDEPPLHTTAPDAQDGRLTHDTLGESRSIETLLAGQRTLEDAFGRLESGVAFDLGVEPEPEVLRLFAPADYHTATTRRPPALPPSLTRREHHALSVDSPLSAPLREEEG